MIAYVTTQYISSNEAEEKGVNKIEIKCSAWWRRFRPLKRYLSPNLDVQSLPVCVIKGRGGCMNRDMGWALWTIIPLADPQQ